MSEAERRADFGGLRVVAFETRRAEAMERLISTYGGRPLVVPALREAPIEDGHAVFEFARELLAGRIDVVILLTGVGTRALAGLAETRYPPEQFRAALGRATLVARGPKPVAALRELGLQAHVKAAEPNTWREVLAALDKPEAGIDLRGRRVAAQEYGAPNWNLIRGLEERGALVRRVPVYRYALHADTAPLRRAIEEIAAGAFDVALFTTSMQAVNLMRLAAEMNLEGPLRLALGRMVVASIGPSTSETLGDHDLPCDLEPTQSRMGALVQEAAALAPVLLRRRQDTY